MTAKPYPSRALLLISAVRSKRLATPSVTTRDAHWMSPKEVLEFAKKNDARQLDMRLTDIPGLQHHVTYPISQLEESSFEDGFGMDGSSIRGWAAINESDMLLVPDATSIRVPPDV